MKAIEVFFVAIVAGMGLAVGVATVVGWILLMRSWVQPVAKALTLTF